MTPVILILAIAGLALTARIGARLYDYVVHDGYGRPRAVPPPRSHPADTFGPRRVA